MGRSAFLLLFVCWSMTACTTIVFDNPQPDGTPDLEAIPEVLQGTWVQGTDTTLIGENFFAYSTIEEMKIPRDELEAMSYEFRGDSLLIWEGWEIERYTYRIADDTIFAYRPEEGFYPLSNDILLRQAGQNYILNLSGSGLDMGEGQWLPVTLSRTSDGVLFRISSNEDLPLLQEILEEEGEQVAESFYQFGSSFSQSTLSQYIRRGGFSDTLFFLHDSTRIR